MNNFMQNKRINLNVKIDQTIMKNVNVDISQKLLMSSILYLFYNANLLKFFERLLFSWTTSNFSFTTSTQSIIIDCWRKCMNIVCCEIVVIKSSSRLSNTNWYILSKILQSLICRRWSKFATLLNSRRVRFKCWKFKLTTS